MNRIQCPITKGAQQYGELPALISGDRVISYNGYEQIIVCAADRLKSFGVARGQRVAIVSNNRWEYPTVLHALLRLGAVACPVSPRFPRKSMLALLRRIDCPTLLDSHNQPTDATAHGIRTIGLDAVFNKQEPGIINRRSDVFADLDDDATIIFTSGSSGQPKAVLHRLGSHYYGALGSNRNIPVQPGDRWLLSLPLYHVGGFGILFRTLLAGAAVVIPSAKESIVESVERHHITHLSLVSTQLYRLVNDRLSFQTARYLKAILVGGSAVNSSLVTRACKAGLPLHTTYGLTEMASQVTTTAPGDPRDRLSTSGKVLDYRDIGVDNREILVRGETLFKGYVEGNTTTLPIDEEGWFHTGDLGHLNGDGYLRFVGRKDNMFISGGENIHPEEIEHAICLLPDVSEALVVPIKDEEFGFRPAAFIHTRGDRQVNEAGLVSHLEHHLPRFKIPVSFYKWPDKVDASRFKPDRRYLTELAHAMKRK